MYQKFYNLTKEPFHITSDPQFLYLSESHKQALASMVYGIEKRKGFVAITGGVGTGKTTVVRAYLDRARSADLKVIYLFQASMTFKELVRIIYQEFDLELTTSNLVDMVNGLHLALIEYYRQGKTVVIIIDEAQNMPIETLENLRMLSNLETPTEKLIQIVLVGQAELDELLEKHELRQLKQRIAIRSRIQPLNDEDSRAYIQHRLSVAGLNNSASIFDKGALDIIVREANGVPRRLNILCDNALITGFGYQKNPVTAGIAKEVVADFRSGNKEKAHFPGRKVAFFIGLGVVAAVLIILLLLPYKQTFTGSRGVSGQTDMTKPQPMPPPASPPADIKPQAAPSTYTAPQTRQPTGTPLHPAPGTKPQVGVSASAVSVPVQQTSEANHQRVESQSGVKPRQRTRVVKHGETLTNLIREVYGLSEKSVLDDSLIKMIKQRNPAITNPDLIIAGSIIQFPDLPQASQR